MKKLLRKLFFRLTGHPEKESSESYIEWLKSRGIKIGKGTRVISPSDISVDITRPELVEIGENVLLHKGTVIMTHDYASRAFVNKYSIFLPSHGRIKLGNNIWLGENVTILKNVEIGDDCIIGSGSVVTKSIPSGSIAVGIPAKVISTFDDYFKKRSEQYAEEAIDYALAIYESGRKPEIKDFYDDYPTFVDGRNYMEYDYPYSRIFTPEQFEQWKKSHRAKYFGYDEFMKAVEEKRNRK